MGSQRAGAAGIVLGIAFAAVAVIIIGATIRMAVLARSREISIMRLVGATDSFVRLPFLLDGFAKGVAGGVLALLLTWLAHTLVARYLVQTTSSRHGASRHRVRWTERLAGAPRWADTCDV
jgi:cell division transport system permease protein